jgi:hypothetical protein
LRNLSQLRLARFIYFTAIIVYLSANYLPNFYQSNFYLKRLDQVTDVILQNLDDNKTFGFYLINQDTSFYGEQYQYYLTTKIKENFLLTEQAHLADQLFVVDESGEADLFADNNFEIKTFLDASASVTLIPYLAETHLKIFKLDKPNREVSYE